MNPIAVFQSMRQEITHQYNLPIVVTGCIKVLSVVHWVWWLQRKRKLLQPENIVPAALGTVLDGVIRLAPNIIEQAVRGIAKLILIATRIDETILRMKALARGFVNLKNAITCKFSPIIEPQWIKNPESIVFSVQTLNRWKTLGKEFIAYIRRIYYCITSIFVKIFKLSMQLWDTYHAFVFSHDALPELFVNGMYWFRKIRHNKDYITSKLDEYRPLIQNIFNATHSTASADNLIDKTKNVLDKVVKGFEKVEKINKLIGENIVQPGKLIIHLIKSKLLSKELQGPRVHTPFVLKKHPDIHWAEKPLFK